MNDAVEKLLQSHKIWHGHHIKKSYRHTIDTGHAILNQFLPGGGWPQAALTEVLIERPGVGELQLVLPALVKLSADQSADCGVDASTDNSTEAMRWMSWIAPPYVPYAPALAHAGINLSRTLIVQAKKTLDVMWAAEQALRCGTCSAVLIWAPKTDNKTLRRLQLAAKEGQSWGIVFRNITAKYEHSPAAVRLQLASDHRGKTLHLLKSRGGRPLRLAADFLIPSEISGLVF